MSSNFKAVPLTHPDPVRAGDLYRLAIVGAGTLKGKEIAEVLGHKTLQMVKRYAHLSEAHTAGVVARMNAAMFPSTELTAR